MVVHLAPWTMLACHDPLVQVAGPASLICVLACWHTTLWVVCINVFQSLHTLEYETEKFMHWEDCAGPLLCDTPGDALHHRTCDPLASEHGCRSCWWPWSRVSVTSHSCLSATSHLCLSAVGGISLHIVELGIFALLNYTRTNEQ